MELNSSDYKPNHILQHLRKEIIYFLAVDSDSSQSAERRQQIKKYFSLLSEEFRKNVKIDFIGLYKKAIFITASVVYFIRSGNKASTVKFQSIFGQVLFLEIVTPVFATFSSKHYSLTQEIKSLGIKLPVQIENRLLKFISNIKQKKSDVFDITAVFIAYNLAHSVLVWFIFERNGRGICKLILVSIYFVLQVLIPTALPHLKIISNVMMLISLNLLSQLLMFDQVDLKNLVACVPIALLFSCDEILQQINQVPKQSQRVNLVDLIGRHDCIYLYFLIAVTVSILFLFDMTLRHSGHLLNFLYFSYYSYQNVN